MFDRLEDLLIRFEEIMSELNEPFVVNDQTRFQKLMKEQSDLQPIVDAYKEYKESKQTVEDSLSMLEEESDEEMREMLKEELNDAKKNIEELEHKLKILLLPKDPNDEKNVIVEIRAGAGGDEAASGEVSSEAIGMDKADQILSDYKVTAGWSSETSQDYAEFTDEDGNFCQIWLENEASIEEKMKLVQEYGLAGVAEWKLGFERSSIWDVIAKYVN